ncbi:CpsB/CapC family capsule biosynthesis tyrosine phosphatase [Proteiniborus sp.]|uniref:tyrosine-protein phosphatase n=1 Tax=Proteiniborus sp. TaxID=2079015 RepID=UPI00332EFBC8
MYDVHCHILPGVDDGAGSLEEAVDMAIMAKNSGVQFIFATPHYIEGIGYKDVTYNREVLDRLNSELCSRNVDIKIYLGCEVYSTPDVLKLLEKGQITTLDNSNYMLIELPMHDLPIYIDSIIYNLKLKGITPIIAHPERNTKIIEDPNILYRLISRGALAQLNLPSILGVYEEMVRNTAEILLRHDMIHFVGTDAHKPSSRYYNISEATNILNNLIGREKTLKITTTNPEAIAAGNNIEIEEPKMYKPKKGIKKIFSKLMRK